MATRRSSRLLAVDVIVTKVVPKENRMKRKAASDIKQDTDIIKTPSTPQKRKFPTKQAPDTPTPAAASMTAVPYTSEVAEARGQSQLQTRFVDEHMSIAPLVSPQTSRIVKQEASAKSSSLSGLQACRTTTGDLLERACEHLLRTEPRLKDVVAKHRCTVFSPEGLAEEIDPFRSLASGILSQQISGEAAKAIKKRFIALFEPGDTKGDVQSAFPSISQIATAEVTYMRTAGLSQRKAEYIKGLAEKFISGDLSVDMLVRAEYDEVLKKLTAVRGLGRWSVEMFACFGLKRMDIFSTGDLGVQRGMAVLLGRDVNKLKTKGGKWKYMSEQEMLDISAKFAPYRSVFMWYMWRIQDVETSSLES